MKEKKGFAQIFSGNSFKTVILIFISVGIFLFFKAFFHPPLSPDTISQWYPFGRYRVEYFFRHFDLPLWRPYINGGTPELDAIFPFPMPYLLTLEFLGTLKTAPGISYTITIILAGIFCYIYLRSLKINNFASFLASLIYMLSGDMISYFYPGHLGKPMVMAFIPITLYLIDCGFRNKKFPFFFTSGVLLGFSYMCHPQIFYYFLLFFSFLFGFKLYLLFQYQKNFKVILNGIIWYSIVGITAVIVASPTLFHQYFYHKLTSRGTLKNEEEMWRFATSWSHHPLELLTYFIPSVFGLYDATYLGWKPFVETTDYIGIITIILAIIGIVIKWKDKLTKFNFIALIIMTLFGFGRHFPAYYKIFYNYVPLINKFRVPASIYLVTTFIIVYFAYWGIVSILNANKDKQIRDKIKKTLLIISIFLFIVSIWIYSNNYEQLLRKNLSQKINVTKIIQKYGLQGEQYIKNIIAKTADMARSDMWKMWFWVGLFYIIYFSFTTGKLKKKNFQILLTILIFLDLYIVDKKFIKTTDNYDIIDKETPVIKFLKQDKEKFRILPILNTNEANKWCLFKLESVTGYHAAGLKIYEDIVKAGLLNNLDFLGLFNVKYIISQKPLNIKDIEPVFQSFDGRIVYLNKKFLPRFFIVDKYTVIKNDEQIISALKENRLNFKKTIILEEIPKINKNTKLSIKDNKVEMIKWDTDIIKFKCNIKNPCFLFLSEVYYPKWKAYINNNSEIKIYKTNYLFRSVFLKKGEYILTFKFYNNGSYLITALIHYLFSIVGIILLIKLLREQNKA